ncbi:hypothetical protein LguiA_010894 [Lonicera macranthoides]
MYGERIVERENSIDEDEDNVAMDEDNAHKKEADCAFIDEIDLNAIVAITNEIPKHNLAYQFVDHIVEEEGPCNLNGDEQPMKIDSLTPIKCIDLNADGGDDVVDLNADGSEDGVNIEPSSETKNFDLYSDGGDDADNIVSGSPAIQLTLSKYDEFMEVNRPLLTEYFGIIRSQTAEWDK